MVIRVQSSSLGTLGEKSKKEQIGQICHNGSVVSNQDEIMEQFLLFYKELFQSEGNRGECFNARETVKKIIPAKILEEDVVDLAKPISTKEIKKAINSTRNDKSPGPDGLSVEFYKEFID